MSVYVDQARHRFGRMIMCHMVADTLPELHEMADKIGINRKWFQNKKLPHYDICLSKKELAIQNGAEVIGIHKMAEIIEQWKSVKSPINN